MPCFITRSAPFENGNAKSHQLRVARGIVERETIGGKREYVTYGVLDPAAFAVISGPSIGETLLRHGAAFRRADNQRISHDKRMGGWTELRARLKGNSDGHPMIVFMDHCRAIIRTLPMLQHDAANPEDVDTDGEDHAAELDQICCDEPAVYCPTAERRKQQEHLACRKRLPAP